MRHSTASAGNKFPPQNIDKQSDQPAPLPLDSQRLLTKYHLPEQKCPAFTMVDDLYLTSSPWAKIGDFLMRLTSPRLC